MTELEAINALWEYHLLDHRIDGPADMIWALGSHDLRVAERAAELWHSGLAPLVVMSGGFGRNTKSKFDRPEAVLFAERAKQHGVPGDVIYIEPDSTNTGENVEFTRKLIEGEGLTVRSAIAVQKPYMERRTFATICKRWPELNELAVTSPQLSFDEFCMAVPRDLVIEEMVGDFQRMEIYAEKGFQIEQPVTEEASRAFEVLVSKGFTRCLIN